MTLPDGAKAQLKDWFVDQYCVVHKWCDGGAWYVVVSHRKVLYFVRLFTIGNAWVLSQDSSTLIENI